ncbi:MAG: IMP dehydrogenase [Candidatus Saccharimonadales bacterium]
MAGNKEAFFDHLEREFTAITFDELTIQNERPSDLDWRDVDLSSKFSRNISAKVPILTSPMTTITESEMGIAAAKEGGGGVIHHANTPDEQKKQVRKVKLHLNGIIEEPITVNATDTIGEVQETLDSQGFDFRTLPVTDENGRFVGLMTNTHFTLFRGKGVAFPVSEAMTPAKDIFTAPSSMKDSPERAYELMQQHKIKLLPLLTEDKRLDSLYLLDDVLRVVEGNPEGYNLDDNGRLRTFMSVSTYDQDAIERVKLSGKYLDLVVIDTSHGESKYSFSTLKALKVARKLVKNLREEFATIDIMVGNVSDPAVAAALAKEGPDAIRVGRGPGGICISREKLGGGTPQASAIYACNRAVQVIDPGIVICGDGGVRGPGDFIKALAVNASSIMVGSYVAGTDEAAASVMTRADGSRYKEYNGMGSAKEQQHSRAARSRYDVAGGSEDELFVEGVEKEIPLQGPVSRKFRELARGARVEMCTGGFSNIAVLQSEVDLRRVTAAGAQEGRASS